MRSDGRAQTGAGGSGPGARARHVTRAAALGALLALAGCSTPAPPAAVPSFDLVIANGRVMDPESGLDAVRHVGVRGGKIEVIWKV